jgi:hypothetical protein
MVELYVTELFLLLVRMLHLCAQITCASVCVTSFFCTRPGQMVDALSCSCENGTMFDALYSLQDLRQRWDK